MVNVHNNDVHIRSALPEDRATLIALGAALQEAEVALHPSRAPAHEVAEPYLDYILAQGAHCLIAEVGGNPVGYVAGWVERDDNPIMKDAWRSYGLISDIVVLESHRGSGIAGQLLNAMEAYLKSKGARRLQLWVLAKNNSALAAYRKAGFSAYETVLEKVLA